ncbi:hypothetical protein Enr13x_72300 [Stieleria neptunia]|uniref:Uncharacterized protein n=1 Tax=Stieleria neptunia TaxID=2527979 RepID=A0A518I2K4_9BACT|nr:hypothetical protein [Stieleria neptunia]QDV47321.1 hypothetical protein Enr13x_72300 [Stieleria neptunia]
MEVNLGTRATQMFLNRKLGTIAALWGVAGTVAVLSYAVFRMFHQTRGAVTHSWNLEHYLVLILWTAFMAYSEGYRGFQRAFSPRVAARSVYLRERSTPLRLLLAPLFCMAFFHAPRKRRLTGVVLLILIASIVVLFRFIPQPWRGILDFGVIIGLGWGIIATVYFLAKYWSSADAPFDGEVVESGDS